MSLRMKDLAKDLNLSAITISKVLRGHCDISVATRERVLRRAKELGYRPNLAARSLVTGRTYMVGLVVPDLKHPFFAEIAGAVGSRIRSEGYRMVIATSEEQPQLEIEAIDSLLAHQVDGLIVASTLPVAQRDVFRRVENQKVPYILVDRRIAGLPADFVGVDDEQIGAMATEHLIQRGSRRIAHIRGPEYSTSTGRFRGYMNTMVRYGLTVPTGYASTVQHPDVNGEEGGFRAMQQLLLLSPQPDAVFCNNDLIAVGALRAVLNQGLRVPDDISLIGVSNLAHMDLLTVPISSIDQGTSLIGNRAAKLLLRRMRSGHKTRPTRVLIPPKLIVRRSSAASGSLVFAAPAVPVLQAPNNGTEHSATTLERGSGILTNPARIETQSGVLLTSCEPRKPVVPPVRLEEI
jgi:LacI family transcriptional regulator